MLGIEFDDRVDILGVTFAPTLALYMKDSWPGVVRAVRVQTRTAYARNLCLAQRLLLVQLCLLAKLWYIAQVFPPSRMHVQQLTTICSWLIWQGATFRVPVTTLQRPKHEGGWDLPNLEVICKSLLYNRIQMLGAKEGSLISELMCHWDLTGTAELSLYPKNSFDASLPTAI